MTYRLKNITTGQFVKDHAVPGRPSKLSLKQAKFGTRLDAMKMAELMNRSARRRVYVAYTSRSWFVSKIGDNGKEQLCLTFHGKWGEMFPTEFTKRSDACAAMARYKRTHPHNKYKLIEAPRGFRACEWCFDEDERFIGFTDDTYWNGFLNVWVMPDVRDHIVAEMRAVPDNEEHARLLADEPLDKNGLVSLAMGFATSEVEYLA
jgi:hypothetical protein